MDQLICASLSHTHYWYEVGMLKVPANASKPSEHPPTVIGEKLSKTFRWKKHRMKGKNSVRYVQVASFQLFESQWLSSSNGT